MDTKKFVKNAMAASDLLQTYGELVLDKTEDLAIHKLDRIVEEVKGYEPKDACEAGAKAMLLFLLDRNRGVR